MQQITVYQYEKFGKAFLRATNPLERERLTREYLEANFQVTLEDMWGTGGCSCGEDPNVPFD